MKKITYIIIALVIFTQALPAAAKREQKITRDKKIHRQYTVSPTDELLINNVFGDIQVNTWDKDEITVDITITAKAPSDEKAEEILDHVSVEEEKTGHRIKFRSEIQSHYSISNNNEVKINYVINMPRKNAIDLTNKFGNVSLGDYTGNLKLELSFGSFTANNLTGKDKKIKISFGSGSIPYIETGEIKLEHTNMDIDKARDINVECSFGKFSINSADDLDIIQKFGNLEIGSVSRLDANVSNSDMSIDELREKGGLMIQFCGRVTIKSVAASIKSFKVDASYSSVYAHFEEGANLNINMEIKFGDFKNRTNNIEVVNAKSDNNTKYFKGKIGKGEGILDITSNFGSVYFK